jgi:hypothetical protein
MSQLDAETVRAVVREELRAALSETRTERHALKRADAAKAMGISVSKLDSLVRTGKVRTAEDSHLIPVAEVKRYCAPKTRRKRKPAIGHRARMKHIDAQSDEAWGEASRRVKVGGE